MVKKALLICSLLALTGCGPNPNQAVVPMAPAVPQTTEVPATVPHRLKVVSPGLNVNGNTLYVILDEKTGQEFILGSDPHGLSVTALAPPVPK